MKKIEIFKSSLDNPLNIARESLVGEKKIYLKTE
jgi:hypothetical protein